MVAQPVFAPDALDVIGFVSEYILKDMYLARAIKLALCHPAHLFHLLCTYARIRLLYNFLMYIMVMVCVTSITNREVDCMIQITDLYEFYQIRFRLPSETTGLSDTVELSIEYQKENLAHTEVWVRTDGDNVKGRVRYFDARNKDSKSESFHQDLITQVNDMPDINEYINAWIWRRKNEDKTGRG